MGVQTLVSPIETAGHPYNSAALPRSLWYLLTTSFSFCLTELLFQTCSRSEPLETALQAGRPSSCTTTEENIRMTIRNLNSHVLIAVFISIRIDMVKPDYGISSKTFIIIFNVHNDTCLAM